ncbi:hypothetical protein P1X15_26305 [Runella sp. MFBS21]|uniref:hypothetical protein n=1 Tax=Runella sp. MFBS21 TaxID=3034018 RepID=UPI0023F8444B|nr:hypothetical protein [Runella sp. MFBS21]MDF7821163.1 hypothetical protein [Runella sp. MFBS21]
MNPQENLRKYLIAWFVTSSIILFVPSIALLIFSVFVKPTLSTPLSPKAPVAIVPPTLDAKLSKELITFKSEIFKKQVDDQTVNYEKQINLYKEQLTVWKQIEANRLNLNPYSIYQLVVKETLVPLITAFLTALITYAFVVKGAESISMYVQEKKEARAERNEARARSEQI